MKIWTALFLAAVCLGGCRLNPDCFRSDECNQGFVCVDRVCVGGTADAEVDGGTPDASDAGDAGDAGDANDAGDADADVPDADGLDTGPADVDDSDSGPRDVGEDDAGPADTGTHTGCRGATVVGNPLPDGRSVLPVSERNLLLLHFDDPNDLGHNAAGLAAANITCDGCTAGACEVYDGFMSGGTLTYEFDAVTPLFVAESLHHLEAWVRWNGNPGCFVRTQTETAGLFGWSLCVDTNGEIAPAQPLTSTLVNSTLVQGRWHHVDIFYDDTNSFVWIDGVQDGGQYTTSQSTSRLMIDSIVVTSSVVEIDELHLSTTLSPQYLTSRIQPRVCSAYQGANDTLFVAGDTLERPQQLQGTGDFPRLATDLLSVVYVHCSPDCSLIEEDIATGATATIATGLQPGLPAAIDARGHYHYVLANQPTIMVRQTPNFTDTLDLTQPITAFDVGWVDGPFGRAPAALVATSDPQGAPRIQVVDFDTTTAALSATVPWDGVAGEEVIRLSVFGVDPSRPSFSTDYEGHWTATVRRISGGSDYLIFGNRNRCSPSCATADPASTIDPAQTPSRYVTGFDMTGRFIIDSFGPLLLIPQPSPNSQLDLHWTYDD